ncbi:LOW QUALITY PROTEIN: hypothetical protein PHMEG_00018404 [Phytophthora megakarya]|uniref:Integrase zinc-binding domain-containing protein n=1 Tax=Phytophthora megakarya TaxID=4795 RepID=A0A225VWN7_9STRA|nr:LOW QUALITY PROTEIN: hypothetical protein PHMEG_00018404 [Phytophthora megakarya]
MEISEVTADSDLIKKIKAIYRRTANLKPKAERQHWKKYRCFTESNGLLRHQTAADDVPRVVAPEDVMLRYGIISECHDCNYGGHPGVEHTYLTLMLASIQTFITDCEQCRRNKPRLTKPSGLLEPLSIPDEIWRSISMDFITDLPQTKNKVNSIWVVIDQTMSFHSNDEAVTAEGVAQRFVNNIWNLHVMLTNILFDRDRKFVSHFWQNVFKSIGTKLSMTVPHCAQGDGQKERMDPTLEEYLRYFVGPW